jgi:hypothetical protein
MLKMVQISAVALAGLFALSAAGRRREAQDTERVDRTVQIRAGGQLRLKNFSGRVTITGSRRGDVAIHAVRRATAIGSITSSSRSGDRVGYLHRGQQEGR